MRTLILTTIAFSLAAALTPAAAETDRSKRHHDRSAYSDNERISADRRQRRLIDSSERDRAQNCDGAGQYSGYPDWARIAFACGSRR